MTQQHGEDDDNHEQSNLIKDNDGSGGGSSGGSNSHYRPPHIAYKSSSSAIIDNRHHHGHDEPDDDHDDDGHGHSHDHGSGSHHHHHLRHISEKVPLYSAPRQRQRWNELQVLPHVNWGDLYFDLFYVSAAYNLSHGFKADPTLNGLLWFVACYLPIFQIWNEKLIYDSRYSPEDNLFHRSMEVIHLCILGTIVWYVQPSFIMSNLQRYPTTMIFTGGCLVDAILYVYWYVDLLKNAVGGPEARNNARMELRRKFVSLTTYTVAFGISVYQYVVVAAATADSGSNKEDVETDSMNNNNNWPAYVMIIGFIAELVGFNLIYTFVVVPKLGHFQEYYVPINLEYVCHRIGEWVMLMLGESILSILTGGSGGEQTQQSSSYATSFYCGILTVTMFQYLFFRSQPSEGKDHAMRRSQLGGHLFFYFHTIYSAALILVGCSYKMMLSPDEMMEELEERYGSSGDDEPIPYDLNQRIAFVYAVSQTVSFVALDAMLWTHRGWKANYQRFFPPHGRFVLGPWLVFSTNAVLLVLTACLSQVHDLTLLSAFGCLLVLGQVVLRTMGMKYFPVSADAMERAIQNDYASIRDDRRWPNVTEPGN